MEIMSSALWRVAAPVTLLLTFSASSGFAQGWDQVGERAQGMAGAFVAVADDATATYWNPAGLATGSTFDAQASGGDEGRVFVGAGLPSLGFSYYRLHSAVPASDSRKNGGSGEVDVSPSATGNIGVTLLQTVVSGLVIGSTLRFANGPDASGFDADLSAMGTFGNLRAGMTVRNLHEAVDSVRKARAGVAWVPRSRPTGLEGPFSVAFDADLTQSPVDSGREMALGSEQWWMAGSVATRVGVHWNAVGDANPAVAGGLTVKLPRSLFAEGHVTKGRRQGEGDWGIGMRVTF